MLGKRVVCALVLSSALSGACSSSSPASAERTAQLDRCDLPLERIGSAELERFRSGDALFESTFRESDGLGPLYIRASCVACHRGDARGPGRVGKMSAQGAEPLASALRFGVTERPYAVAGATQPILAAAQPGLAVNYRFPPAVFGRGYLEAVADSEIEALERAARVRSNGIRGRIHRLPAQAGHAPATGIGRFGFKARLPTLDDFTADAFQGDMGLTSPTLPNELDNPESIRDDQKPGIDLSAEVLARVADYVRLLEIPARGSMPARGSELFAEVLCATCHVPALRTRADYPVAALAATDAPIYSDLLLHDMGELLSDGVQEGDAGPREWRTAPLLGLRFFAAFLHDGRARSVEEAVLAHGGPGSEASISVERFQRLQQADRATLLRFVESL